MRIEELENNMYIKSTDSVEKFLLNVIQEYFKDSNEAIEGSKEYIIREAVDRLKTEMDYNSLGVLSVTLQDGIARTGEVNITLAELGGEPEISPKLSAFNVNFGTKANTACEGNDPRLYNARTPLKHEHEISDIRGLEGRLSSIDGQIARMGGSAHTHSNKDVLDKLVYTGFNNTIDLTVIDSLEPKIDAFIEEVRTNIQTYIQNTQTEIQRINQTLNELNQEIDNIHAYVIEKCDEYLLAAKQYTDNLINTSVQEFKDYCDANFVNKTDIMDLIDIAENCYVLLNEDKFELNDLIFGITGSNRTTNLALSQKTLDEFDKRSMMPNDTRVIFKLYLEYTRNNITYRQPLPYADNFSNQFEPYLYYTVKPLTIAGYIQALRNTSTNNVLQLIFMTNENQIPSYYISTGKIIVDIYARNAPFSAQTIPDSEIIIEPVDPEPVEPTPDEPEPEEPTDNLPNLDIWSDINSEPESILNSKTNYQKILNGTFTAGKSSSISTQEYCNKAKILYKRIYNFVKYYGQKSSYSECIGQTDYYYIDQNTNETKLAHGTLNDLRINDGTNTVGWMHTIMIDDLLIDQLPSSVFNILPVSSDAMLDAVMDDCPEIFNGTHIRRTDTWFTYGTYYYIRKHLNLA